MLKFYVAHDSLNIINLIKQARKPRSYASLIDPPTDGGEMKSY